MVPADSTGVSPAPAYSGYPPLTNICRYAPFTLCGLTFQTVPVNIRSIMQVLQPRMGLDPCGLGSSAFARHYLRNHCYFLFLRVLRCFSSPGWLFVPCLQHGGLSHSDIRGSMVACTSPQLFAACRVLLRLQKPRHPLCALDSSSFVFLYIIPAACQRT